MPSTGTATGRTERLCRFVAGTTYGELPEAVLDHATRMIVDSLGVTVAGADSEPAAVIRDAFPDAYGSEGPARVPGTELAGSPRDVAFLAGTMAHALDFDDVHQGMGGHPSTPVLSALLPVAEREGASGRDLLRAFVLGTEVEITLAEVLNPGHYERGWHPTAILGTVGAAAAVGDLLDLDATELRTALGIAASEAAGIKGNFGTMTKPLHVGNAARSGQEAAELAAGGFTANRRILELDFGGFCDLFQGEPPHDFADHLDRLGSPWGLLDPPVGFKPYPCCGSAHAAIDAALTLRERQGVTPEAVDRIRIREHPRRLGHTDDPSPETSLDGKFSVQYCVAVALGDGDVWLHHFDDDAVTDPRYRSLVERTETIADSEGFSGREWGAAVTVVADGTEHTAAVDAPKGSAEVSLSAAELEEKYRRCVSRRLDADAADASLDVLESLETVEDVGTVVDAFV